MRKIQLMMFSFFALFSLSAFAEEAQLTWSITEVTLDGEAYNRLELDVVLGPRYIKANGAIANSETFLTLPATGTCFLTSSDGAFCNVQAGLYLFSVNLNAELNGSYLITQPNGEQAGPGSVTLLNIQ